MARNPAPVHGTKPDDEPKPDDVTDTQADANLTQPDGGPVYPFPTATSVSSVPSILGVATEQRLVRATVTTMGLTAGQVAYVADTDEVRSCLETGILEEVDPS